MRKILSLLLAAAMLLSLVVVASATGTEKQSVYLKTEKKVNGDNTVTYTFTLDASQCDGVAALEFIVEPTDLEYVKYEYPEAAKAKLEAVFTLEENFDGGTSTPLGFYPDANKFLAFGGNAAEKRILTDEVPLISLTYSIKGSDYALKITSFKACLSGKQAALKDTRYTCEAKPVEEGGNEVMLGDVNGDGKIKMNDAMAIYNYLMGNIEFSDDQFKAADVTNDGKIKMNDVMKVYNYVMGTIDSLD